MRLRLPTLVLTVAMIFGCNHEPTGPGTEEQRPGMVTVGRVLADGVPVSGARVTAIYGYTATCTGEVFGNPVTFDCLKYDRRDVGTTGTDGAYSIEWRLWRSDGLSPCYLWNGDRFPYTLRNDYIGPYVEVTLPDGRQSQRKAFLHP
jgi:hypothetical protein